MLKSSEPQNKIRSGSDIFWDAYLRDWVMEGGKRAARGRQAQE